MNKDEMIEENEMIKRLQSALPDTETMRFNFDKIDLATYLYDAGCRIVGEDEIVVKKRQYEQLKKYNRDRKRLRLKWQQAKQETKEILQTINKYLVGTRGIYTIKTFRNSRFEDLMLVRADDLEMLVKKLAKEHGVELED